MGWRRKVKGNTSEQEPAGASADASADVSADGANASSDALMQALVAPAVVAPAVVAPQAPIEVIAKAPIEISIEALVDALVENAVVLPDVVTGEATGESIRVVTRGSTRVLTGESAGAPAGETNREPAEEPAGEPTEVAPAKSSGKSRGKHIRKRSFIRDAMEFIVIILMAVIITMLLRAFVIDNYEIPTGSMEPTIEIDDRIFAEKLSYRFGSPARGDIVTFHDPIIQGRVLIKRCIAVAGDVIDIKNGKVYINGVLLDEPHVHGKETFELSPLPSSGTKISYPYRIPEGMIWVMGDNRTHSSDSRAFGPVPESELIGKALFRFLPLSRFGKIE